MLMPLEIKDFFYRFRTQLIATFFLLVLFFPFGVNALHAFECHDFVEAYPLENEQLLESEPHCGCLDFYFTPIVTFDSLCEVVPQLNVVGFQPSGYILKFKPRTTRIPSSRRPPSFLI